MDGEMIEGVGVPGGVVVTGTSVCGVGGKELGI